MLSLYKYCVNDSFIAINYHNIKIGGKNLAHILRTLDFADFFFNFCK